MVLAKGDWCIGYLFIICLICSERTSNAFSLTEYFVFKIFFWVLNAVPPQKGEVPPDPNM